MQPTLLCSVLVRSGQASRTKSVSPTPPGAITAKEVVPLGMVATVDGRGLDLRNTQFALRAVGRAPMQSGLYSFTHMALYHDAR
jgi:hypothetical protein